VADLAKDAFGNYVVQYMIRSGELLKNSNAIVNGFCPRIIDLACDKFASNVLEKAIEAITADAVERIINEIYSVPQWQLQRLLNDGVGNYIVQASIASCTPQQLYMISSQLTPLLSQVPYGGKIEAKLQQRAAVTRHA
jgi:pumilio RNA-binding family